MNGFMSFLKREPVFCASAVLALASCFFVPPDAGYAGYVDIRTVALLYCLMVVVAGLTEAGVLSAAGRALCARAGNGRALALALTALCFFSSMLVTNDVALITFVPFTAALLDVGGRRGLMPRIAVLETVAANLGSMLTSVGNPQNIYLYSKYGMRAGDFFKLTVPVCAVSLALLLSLCLCVKKTPLPMQTKEKVCVNARLAWVCAALFALCIAAVLRLVGWYWALAGLAAVMLAVNRRLLLRADFMLLLTFVCFFVFVGNLGRIEAVSSWLRGAVTGKELLAGALTSQVISNVPAAALLSGFTENAGALLLGVNIGGLGTPVASLASLITLKFCAAMPEVSTVKYLLRFLAVNFSMLAVLLLFAGTVLV